MAINIPKNVILKQSNRSDILGDIVESYNIDLNSNLGSIRTTKAKLVYDENDDVDFGNNNQGVSTIEHTGSIITVASGGFFWQGGTAPSDSLTQDATSGTPSDLQTSRSSGTKFNGGIYVPGLTSLRKFKSSAWTNITSPTLDGTSPHICTTLGNNLYVTNLFDKVGSLNTSDVLSLSGTATLDLGLEGYSITWIEGANDRIWIGVSSTGNDGVCWVYEWDGETTNTPTRRYTVTANGVVSGKVKDGIPYIVDTRGRFMALSGGVFIELARFPIGNDTFENFDSTVISGVIHPKGIGILGDEILINISNLKNSSTVEFFDFPAGVWAWSINTGLYHKYSPSIQPVADIGTTNLTDYGQMRIGEIGPLSVIDPINPSSTDNGLVIFSAGYYPDADDATTDQVYGLFTSDELDTSQDWGYLITSKQFSSSVSDNWQKVYSVYKNLLNATDKIVVKYRTEEDTPIEINLTWVTTSQFTTTSDLSATLTRFGKGLKDEVQVKQGKGSGKSAHISSITESGGTYTVNLDDTFIGVTGTAIAEVSQWVKAGEITNSNKEQFKGLTFSDRAIGPWSQVKVGLQFTGKNELYKLRIINKPNVKE